MGFNKLVNLVKEREDSVQMNFDPNLQGTVNSTDYHPWQAQEQDRAHCALSLRDLRVLRGEMVL